MRKFKIPFPFGYLIAWMRILIYLIRLNPSNKLDLSNLNLMRLPIIVSFLKTYELNASGNRLKSLPLFFGRYQQKHFKIILYDNRFTAIPKEILNHKYLCSIDLLGNQIKEIPKEVAKMPKLTEIELGYNELEEIPAFISTMNLVHFCIQGNPKITKLPNDFGSQGGLRKLHLEGTSIKKLPKSIVKNMELMVNYHQPIIKPVMLSMSDFSKMNLSHLTPLSLPLEAMSIPIELKYETPKVLLTLAMTDEAERKTLIKKHLDLRKINKNNAKIH